MGHALSGEGKAIYQPSVIDYQRKRRAKKARTARRTRAVLQQGQQIRYRSGMGSEFYLTQEWRKVRWQVLDRSDGRCAMCGRSKRHDGVTLHVDHIQPRKDFPELELAAGNLQVLCMDCNLGKGALRANTKLTIVR